MVESTALTTVEAKQLPAVAHETLVLIPVLSPAELAARRKELFEVVKNILIEGEHYGPSPGGGNKKNLLKPGAEILNQYFGFYAEFEKVQSVEQWDKQPPLFDYEYKAVIRSKRDERKVAEGVGSCNSWESKYRYRNAQRNCPQCGGQFIIKGKEEYGGGWVCWAKDKSAGACGAKFKENDTRITEQPVGKVENDDIASLKNTILKMAKKRAYIDATLQATGASEIFTQDIEDLPFTVEALSVKDVSEAVQQQKDARAKKQSSDSSESSETGSSDVVDANTTSPAQSKQQDTGAGQPNDGKDNEPVGKEQMTQLVQVAKNNLWSRDDLNKILAELAGPEKKVTWKVWKEAVDRVSKPKPQGEEENEQAS